jgi:ferredoxin
MPQQESKCPVMATKLRLEKFYNDDSKDGMCSKCHPCKLGIYDAIKILETIQSGKGLDLYPALLQRIAVDVKDGGMCKKGKDHADILAAFLKDFSSDLGRHIKGVCTHHECARLIRYEIDPSKCTMCNKCAEVCKDHAVEGQKLVPGKTGFTPYRIRQKRCTHCGECIKVCPEGAVIASDAALAGEEKPVQLVKHTVGTCPLNY